MNWSTDEQSRLVLLLLIISSSLKRCESNRIFVAHKLVFLEITELVLYHVEHKILLCDLEIFLGNTADSIFFFFFHNVCTYQVTSKILNAFEDLELVRH